MSHPAEKDAAHPVLIVEKGDSYIDGLRKERAGYETRGLADRVKEVDAELARVGGEVETADAEELPETATPTKPRARKK